MFGLIIAPLPKKNYLFSEHNFWRLAEWYNWAHMSSNDFLEKIREDNDNYFGKLKSLSFIVLRGKEEKKIFKWFFTPGELDFYIAFPYFKTSQYHCGIVEIPEKLGKDEVFDAVKNGKASTIPVKFSYHKDGN